MQLADLQQTLRDTYLDRDAARGADATYRWLVEEVGELARALRRGERDNLVHEIGDVLAWLGSLANLVDVELVEAVSRFASGCPKCGRMPCACEPA
jgi:NTP pyrophosphatase (non-canonical NTP hydrolase)